MKNLTMLGNLRQQKQISSLRINFVIQRDNYLEMKAFVKLGLKIHADRIHFAYLRRRSHVSESEYQSRSMLVNGKTFHPAIQSMLKDPIFRLPVVHLDQLARFLDFDMAK